MSKLPVTVGIALILIAAPIIGAVGATSPAATNDVSADSSDEELSTGIENVSIWERSVLPFRANRTAAATTVDLPYFFVNGPNGSEVDANRDTAGLFNAGDDIPLELESLSAANTSQYAGDARVIVAEPNSNTSLGFAESVAMLNVSNVSELNENMTFTSVANTSITDEGELFDNVSYNDTSTGQYVAMVATIDSGNGITVDSGNLVVDGKSTIVGLDAFQVQDDTSDVSASAGEPGENVTVTAETSIDTSGDVGHAVLLYDEATFTDAKTTLNITTDSDGNVTGAFLESDISDLNGVFRFDDDAVNNSTIAELNSTIQNQTGSDGTVLDASATAVVSDGPNATIDVGTLSEWEDGEYRYVHVAVDDSGQQLQTSTDTVTIEADSGGGGGGGFPAPPDDGGDDDDKGDKPAPAITFSSNPATVGESVTISGAESTDTKWEIVSYEWSIGGQEHSGETVTTTFNEPGEYGVELTVTNEIDESATLTKTLTVEEPATDGQDPDDGDDSTDGSDDAGNGDDGGSPIPGFGTTIAIVALLSVALLLGRQQN